MKSKIVIAGGSGFIGQELANYFKNKFQVIVLTRGNNKVSDGITYINWDAKSLGNWANELEGAEALINLTGKSVNCRYNEANKTEIYASRLNSTAILGEAIKQCKQKPKVWMNAASGTIYRNEYEKPNTETDGIIGEGFSVDVCQKWEQLFYSFSFNEVRQINLRIAIVLQKDKSVMIPFKNLAKFGLGGKAGSGKQMFSWIHVDDFCSAINYFLNNTKCVGTYNLAAPNAVTNAYFMQQVREKLNVLIGINQPKWVLEIGAWLISTETELLLKSRWVYPERLIQEGFEFKYKRIEDAILSLI
jgi:uncharacterized protein (TIGR01777 family)